MKSRSLSLGTIIPCILWALLFGLVTCDIEKDKERCANQLIGAATCLPYVSGEANVPPMDCCTGFNKVVQKSPECVCLLVKDRDDPSLGIKINVTRALGLPTRCHAPVNLTVNDCPSLLHLPSNSPDAKVFQDFADNANKNNTFMAPSRGTPSRGTMIPSNQRSEGGKGRILLGAQFLLAMVAVHTLLNL